LKQKKIGIKEKGIMRVQTKNKSSIVVQLSLNALFYGEPSRTVWRGDSALFKAIGGLSFAEISKNNNKKCD